MTQRNVPPGSRSAGSYHDRRGGGGIYGTSARVTSTSPRWEITTRFLRPADRVLFEAVREVVSGLSLAEASAAVEGGRVVEAASGKPVRWRGAPMVYPVSARLRERVTGSGYEAEVERARRALQLRVVPP